jgi:hypothetical protein
MLLYVSGTSPFRPVNEVFVYDYKTGALVGWLTGFEGPQGMCVDKDGNVWITNSGGSSVVEYSHGRSKRLKTLIALGATDGCSVDPTSGDLAVVGAISHTRFGSGIEVFRNASGRPHEYTTEACSSMSPPGYDLNGNLYVEGANSASTTEAVCELPHRGKAMRSVSFNVPISPTAWGVGVMWDGKYITLDALSPCCARPYTIQTTVIYQMREDKNGNLAEAGKTVLSDGGACAVQGDQTIQPFIVGTQNTPLNKHQGTAVVASNDIIYCPYRFDYWSYPAGGNPQKVLDDAPASTAGQAVSIVE